MKSIFVTTPDNIKVEYRLAGAGSRLGAAVVDTAIQFSGFLIITLVAIWVMFDFNDSQFLPSWERFANVAAVALFLYFAIFLGYFLVFEIVMKGQTPGKRLFGLRTIRANGQPITFIQSIIRNVIRVSIDNVGIGLIMMILNKNHLRLGDILAGTIVISENPSKYKSESLLWRPGMDDTEIRPTISSNYPITITYEEYEIIKDYFSRKNEFIESGKYAETRVREYFAQKFEIDMSAVDEGFLKQIMDEYSKY